MIYEAAYCGQHPGRPIFRYYQDIYFSGNVVTLPDISQEVWSLTLVLPIELGTDTKICQTNA